MNLPKPVSGAGALAVWINQLRLYCASLILRSGPGYRIKRTPNGTFIELIATPGGGAGAASSPGMHFRGLWSQNPAAPYAVEDVVLLQGGPTAGTYICITANNSNAPNTGVGWIQIAPGNTIGAWL